MKGAAWPGSLAGAWNDLMDGSESRENVLAARCAGAPPRHDRIAACWSCRGPVAEMALFCGTCAAVQPPGQADHFTRLGLGFGFDVDPGLLDRRYFERQRQLHPDRFVTRTARERALSQSQATAINEAYETLKDPLRRADYLLHLGRNGAAPEGCHLVNDLELLTEAMELREALAEAGTARRRRGAGATGGRRHRALHQRVGRGVRRR